MELYIRFMGTLAFGLVGLGMVLKVLLEKVFHDWDAFADLQAWYKSLSENRYLVLEPRTEDIMLELEKSKAVYHSTRLIEQKREQLREIDEIEQQLQDGPKRVELTPLYPPAAVSSHTGS